MQTFTLTSDFGLQSHAAASVKGKILSAFSPCNIIDVSHSITPYNLQQAVYIFKNAYIHFPIDTFHFILNDLYADKGQKLLYVYENNQHIFCADNGFLTLLFDNKPIQLFRLIDKIEEYNYLQIADLFILNAGLLTHQNKSGIANIDVNEIVLKHHNNRYYRYNTLETKVLYIDIYGNVILNVTQQQIEEVAQGRSFKILFMRNEEINTVSKHYNDVAEGNKLCLFNTTGHLEIAVNKGHAASLFGFQGGNDRSLFYNNIKLFFE